MQDLKSLAMAAVAGEGEAFGAFIDAATWHLPEDVLELLLSLEDASGELILDRNNIIANGHNLTPQQVALLGLINRAVFKSSENPAIIQLRLSHISLLEKRRLGELLDELNARCDNTGAAGELVSRMAERAEEIQIAHEHGGAQILGDFELQLSSALGSFGQPVSSASAHMPPSGPALKTGEELKDVFFKGARVPVGTVVVTRDPFDAKARGSALLSGRPSEDPNHLWIKVVKPLEHQQIGDLRLAHVDQLTIRPENPRP